MARPKKTESAHDQVTPFIVPIVKVEGQKHDLEKMYEEAPDDMPEMKAVGFMHLDKGRRHAWISYTMTVKGDRVIKMEVSEPDMQAIAEENAKIEFVNCFTDVGGL